MLETNVRIVRPGSSLEIAVRRATVHGPSLNVDLLERACNSLRYRYGLAAVKCNAPDVQPGLLVATKRSVPSLHLEDDEWEIDVEDSGESLKYIAFQNRADATLLPRLIDRALLAQIAKRTNLWTLNTPRIWYEAEPFHEADGIAVYRRYEIASILIDGVGIGIAVDIGTAFFTAESMAYYFPLIGEPRESDLRKRRFEMLTGRQQGQKGTLLYYTGIKRHNCYFENAPSGKTCATTGKIRLKGNSYPSLTAYYQEKYPGLPILDDERAIQVSFPGLERPQWVAANQVYVRVMNDNVPASLKNVDKIAPKERRRLVEAFWSLVGPSPLGKVADGLEEGFWEPSSERVVHLAPPPLQFGQQQTLPSPSSISASAFRYHFSQRLEFLEHAGCYSPPVTGSRQLSCAYPATLPENLVGQFAGDIATTISKWTGQQIVAQPLSYTNVTNAVEQLYQMDRGFVLFVLDNEPAAYYEAAFYLDGWRLKRITEHVLRQQGANLRDGGWDKQRRMKTKEKGQALWNQFILMNSLDVLQLMDGIPWRIDNLGPYEAQIVIDVGHDRRYFSLSLLIARTEEQTPSFCIRTNVRAKADHRQETINPCILKDEIIRLLQESLGDQFDSLKSLLILRDGRTVGDELQGITDSIDCMRNLGLLVSQAQVDVVDIHKESLKPIRLWDRGKDGDVNNPLEGTTVLVNEGMALLTTTGSATLHQGTAEPVMLFASSPRTNLRDAAYATFAGAQLNWSSPRVAQRLPLPLKRTDDELQARAAQEVRRLR